MSKIAKGGYRKVEKEFFDLKKSNHIDLSDNGIKTIIAQTKPTYEGVYGRLHDLKNKGHLDISNTNIEIIARKFPQPNTYAKGGLLMYDEIDRIDDVSNIHNRYVVLSDGRMKFTPITKDSEILEIIKKAKIPSGKKEEVRKYLNFEEISSVDEEGNTYAKGGKIDIKLKDWYKENYPTDELGEEMNDTNTFENLEDALNKGDDVYNTIGVGDSVIRERLFEHFAKIKGEKYEFIYQKWLGEGMITDAEIKSIYKLEKGGKISYDDVKERVLDNYGYSVQDFHKGMMSRQEATQIMRETNELYLKLSKPQREDLGMLEYAKGGSLDEETLVVDVVWRQLDEKGLGKFNLKESDVERLEDNYGSTYYFEVYDDTNENPISYIQMKNILDKSMKDMGLMDSNYAKGGDVQKRGREMSRLSKKWNNYRKEAGSQSVMIDDMPDKVIDKMNKQFLKEVREEMKKDGYAKGGLVDLDKFGAKYNPKTKQMTFGGNNFSVDDFDFDEIYNSKRVAKNFPTKKDKLELKKELDYLKKQQKKQFAKGGKIELKFNSDGIPSFKSEKDYQKYLRSGIDGDPRDIVEINGEVFIQDYYDSIGKQITYRSKEGNMLEIENSNRYKNGFGDSEVFIEKGHYTPYEDLPEIRQRNFPFAKGGRTFETKNDLYNSGDYNNVNSLSADINKYFNELEKDLGKDYADEMRGEVIKDIKKPKEFYAKGGKIEVGDVVRATKDNFPHSISGMGKGQSGKVEEIIKLRADGDDGGVAIVEATNGRRVEAMIKNLETFEKGGEVKKKENNEMIIGGLAGILFGFFLNR